MIDKDMAIDRLKWIRIQCDSELKREIDRIITLIEFLSRQAELGEKFEKACLVRLNKENGCWDLDILNEMYKDFCRLRAGREQG